MTFVGSIRADVTRRLLTLVAMIAVLATACSGSEPPQVDYESGRFVAAVADSLDDVGLGSAVAVGEDGTVYVSYLGFPTPLEPGQVATQRPVGAPFLPAVALTSVTPEGLFSRGAVIQDSPAQQPVGIEPPFRPVKVEGFDLTAANANGTDVAIGPDGTVHVVWAGAAGIYHAAAAPGEDSVVETVLDHGSPITFAGPIGRPSITLDGSGAPWIAYGVNGAHGVEVTVARSAGGDEVWDREVVATAERCNGCPPPMPAGITTAGETPIVVFGDGQGTVRAVRLEGDAWVESTVETGADGAGLSTSTDGERAFAAYYTGDGTVHVATFSGGGWSTAEVATAGDPTVTTGTAAPTTGVAASGETVAVTWEDADGVHLATGDGSTFTAATTSQTEGGGRPSVTMSADGAITLAWVNLTTLDLIIGILSAPDGLIIANPSPAPTVSLADAPVEGCGDDKKAILEITGTADNLFDKDCLVAPADDEFAVTFINQGGTHNFQVLTEAAGNLLTTTPDSTGPATTETEPIALEAGSYYFQCFYHPTTMKGTIASVKGAK